MPQLRRQRKEPANVQASQTVEVRAKMRALQWIADEFPDEYKELLAQGVNSPKKTLADRHRTGSLNCGEMRSAGSSRTTS